MARTNPSSQGTRPSEQHDEDSEITGDELVNQLASADFKSWFRDRQRTQNIEQGKSYFNGPPNPPAPERHRPSLLRRCHRYAYYRRKNAPAETSDPLGLFWFGSEFEEHVIVPFLQDVTPASVFVQNSVWVNTSVDHDGEELVVKGMTDPVLVDETGTPLVVTEIKTSSSVEYRTGPSRHHEAQLQSYLFGLNAEHDHNIPGVVVYTDRESFDFEAFTVDFDPDVWADVVAWMETQSAYEHRDELPPDDPVERWECEYCDYRARCGQTSEPFNDVGPEGFLTLFEYPKEAAREHVEAHDDVALSPTLANLYPDLADEYCVNPWKCPSCLTTYHWDTVDWDGDVDEPPFCPECLTNDEMVVLRGATEL